ncbi:YybH family protein [Dickeya dianthicola]|uniref:YybH family protein n=1 Tax=Dickeya dianthicola TaxID=204039 RepID=UPI00136B7F95|nr:nuclear transport factor 2 family protein [Dickeya dianthicola]MZH98850.1 hypothetical protein [Dickeya dianthicola]
MNASIFPRKSVFLLPVLAIGMAGVALTSLAASDTSPNMNPSSVSSSADDRAVVQAVPLAYFSALRDRNIGALLAMYSEGGELSAPFMLPAAGASALRTTYENLFKAVRFEMTHKVGAVTIMSPTWALVRTSSTGSTITLATGEARRSAFEELFVLRKDDDGKWRIARYMTTPTT